MTRTLTLENRDALKRRERTRYARRNKPDARDANNFNDAVKVFYGR